MNKDRYETIKSLDELFQSIDRGEAIFCNPQNDSLNRQDIKHLIGAAPFSKVAEDLRQRMFVRRFPNVRYRKTREILSFLKVTDRQIIIDIICESYSVTFDNILTPNKSRAFTEPRQVLAVILTYSLKLGRVGIAEILAMHHSEVTRSLQKVDGMLEVDRVFEKSFKKLIQKINNAI